MQNWSDIIPTVLKIPVSVYKNRHAIVKINKHFLM